MSAKKIKSILFYLVPLGLLFSYIFTTCYGVELDQLGDRLITVEEDLKKIQDQIKSGKIIESVTPITGGFKIKFTDNTEYNIVNGLQGAQGIQGPQGKYFYISKEDSLWHDSETQAPVYTDVKAIPRDGAPAKAPTPSEDGYWIFYDWDPVNKTYKADTTELIANTEMSYVVDFGDYYELYTPVQKRDENGNLLMKTHPVTGKQSPDTEWKYLQLPRYDPDPEPALVFKFIGYARVLPGDSIVKMEPTDLDLKYTWLDFVHYDNPTPTPVSEDSAVWKWKWRGPEEIKEDQFRIARLMNDSLAVVFSINRDLTQLDFSTSEPLRLRDTKNSPMEAFRLDRPKLLNGLITKAGDVGSNNDTVYFARMRNRDPWLASVPTPLQSGKVYYRLVINDTVRSELSPFPLEISNAWPLAVATVDKVEETSSPYTQYPLVGTRYELPNDSLQWYDLTFFNPGSLFDYYLSADTVSKKIKLAPRTVAPADTFLRAFRIDTTLKSSGDEYSLPIEVYILQNDGVIRKETITVRTSEP
ncbi:MAG: hypothetical protein LBP25_04365 [Tannerellaceae bacterium]|jgi:hypothetical protein|nr:hypothetical protein [Tannerellaceae bacterium]